MSNKCKTCGQDWGDKCISVPKCQYDYGDGVNRPCSLPGPMVVKGTMFYYLGTARFDLASDNDYCRYHFRVMYGNKAVIISG